MQFVSWRWVRKLVDRRCESSSSLALKEFSFVWFTQFNQNIWLWDPCTKSNTMHLAVGFYSSKLILNQVLNWFIFPILICYKPFGFIVGEKNYLAYFAKYNVITSIPLTLGGSILFDLPFIYKLIIWWRATVRGINGWFNIWLCVYIYIYIFKLIDVKIFLFGFKLLMSNTNKIVCSYLS